MDSWGFIVNAAELIAVMALNLNHAQGTSAGNQEGKPLLLGCSNGLLVVLKIGVQIGLGGDHIVNRHICLRITLFRQPVKTI